MNGFTIVELMVTISIAAILMAVAAPNYTTFIRNSQLSDAVGEFMTAANAARGNAIKQGINTFLVPATGTDWSTGWYVFADGNWDGVYTASDPKDVLVMQSPSPNTILTVTTPTASTLASGYLLFNGSGYPKMTNGGLGSGRLKIANGTTRAIIISINTTGRVRSCVENTTTCKDTSPN
jgi:type IV fimbrial biogenesis protein FimT